MFEVIEEESEESASNMSLAVDQQMLSMNPSIQSFKRQVNEHSSQDIKISAMDDRLVEQQIVNRCNSDRLLEQAENFIENDQASDQQDHQRNGEVEQDGVALDPEVDADGGIHD